MLSIGKLAAGQANYYLEQADVRVDVVDSIGGGLEEYYVGGREARGVWVGHSAARLGLAHGVDGEALRCVLAGLAPDDGGPLRGSGSPVRVAGFDLTFSAPKSVSVVFGIGGAEVECAVRGAHDRAVVEAVGYLERSAAAVRRGAGGHVVEPTAGLVAAAFRHRTSRVGDPQLHTHVLVANLGMGPDGRWSALDGRRLYAHARTASFVYQAVLRSELTRDLCVEWLPVRHGIAELVGVPKRVTRAFSRRRREIELAMVERGTSSPRAAEAAALATRRPKDRAQAVEALTEGWRARAAAPGFGRTEIARLAGRRRAREDVDVEEGVADRLAGRDGLTRRRSTFTRRDVIQGLSEQMPSEAVVTGAMLEDAADRFLASSRVVALVGAPDAAEEGEAFRRRDGRVVPVERAELTYSTAELLSVEQRFMDRVIAGAGLGVGAVDAATLARAVAERPSLSVEQRAMVERLCRAGERVAVVVGRAGTGKTFALGVARAAWQDGGHAVLGVAVARRAADELASGAGIASTSAAALLGGLEGRGEALPERCVLVVDEAGMVPTRQLASLLDHVEAADGKLVLVGDHRQLPALEAGGAFRGLVQRGLAVELRENRRQVERWERVALERLREGRAADAIALYQAHGRVRVEVSSQGARERLVHDWRAAQDGDKSVMIARRREDVADLNARARDVLREAGELGARELRLPGGAFAIRDRVVVKLNDLQLGVANGERGSVVGVGEDSLTVELRGRAVRLDREFLTSQARHGDPTLVHGYAITGHVAQGLTVDRAFVLADGGLSREWAYTAMSRGRLANHLYVATESDDARDEFAPGDPNAREPIARLVAALGRSDEAELAINFGPRAGLADLDHARAVAAADRRRLQRRRNRWMPGGGRRLNAAHDAEAVIARQIKDERRRRDELRHGSRGFETEDEIDAQVARLRERIVERRAERDLGRDLGR